MAAKTPSVFHGCHAYFLAEDARNMAAIPKSQIIGDLIDCEVGVDQMIRQLLNANTVNLSVDAASNSWRII